MTIFNLYSKRKKKLTGDVPEVYLYDNLPKELKTQIVYLWHDVLGNEHQYRHNKSDVVNTYTFIVDTLCREYGQFTLIEIKGAHRNYLDELTTFFIQEKDIDKQLDVVEITFWAIDELARGSVSDFDESEISKDALKELNLRFFEHGVGFQFQNGKIIRVDTEFTHSEIVKPALRFLNESDFEGAQEEFLSAHEHYRKGNSKEALNCCLKSFESTMKIICDRHGWEYNKEKDTANKLISILFEKELIPSFWQAKFSSLRSLLESSVPTGRNKMSGHGQGGIPKKVPQHIVAYMINMTASSIVFLIKADKELQ